MKRNMTNFSDFIRNGTPEEKEKVFNKVIEDSIEDQKKIIRYNEE
jgi:hypothetical protein